MQIKLEYKRESDTKGYQNLCDILNTNGELFTQEELSTRGLKIHFIDYLKIKRNIKNLEKMYDKEPLKYGPCLPRILFEIRIVEKGSSRTYNKLMVTISIF